MVGEEFGTATIIGMPDPAGGPGVIDFVANLNVYDADGRLVATEAGNGQRRVDYVLDGDGRVTQETVRDITTGHITDDKVETKEYDANGNITRQVVTQAGRSDETRMTYDANDQVLTQLIEGGVEADRVTTYVRSDLGHAVSVADPLGRTTTTDLDIIGRSVRVISPSVDTQVYGLPVVAQQPDLVTGYNTFGEVTEQRTHDGEVTTMAFDGNGRRTLITHPTYVPPTGGQSITPTETFVYDAVGNLISRVDRRGHQTDFEFDAQNRPAIERQPAATTGAARGEIRTRYDATGNVVWIEQPDGQVATATYDVLGRQLTSTQHVRQPGGTIDLNTTAYTYDGAGNAITIVDPEGNTTTQLWSPTGKLLAVTDPTGATTTSTYDVAGRLLTETDPLDREVRNTYDAFGQLTESARYDTTDVKVEWQTFTYDAVGNRTSLTTATGNTTTYTYDALNRLALVTQPVGGGTPDIVTTYGYDVRGLQTRMTDGNGNVWYRTYNVWGLLEDFIEPATATTPTLADRTYTTSYDPAGLPIVEQQPGGITVTRDFDALGRMTNESGGTAGGTRTLYYDLSGRTTEVSHPTGVLTITYDDRGLVTDVDSPDIDSSFTYDNAGRMTSRTDAAGTTQYSWTSRSQLYGLTDPATGQTRTHTYNGAGELTDVDYGGGGLTRTFTYDSIGRPAIDRIEDSGTLRWRAIYDYNADGNLTLKRISPNTVAGGGLNTYTYDNAGRLATWTGPGSDNPTTYTYDGVGNRLTAGSTTFTYDERNRLLTEGAITYTWTARGTMASRTEGGSTTNYTFDGLGRMLTAGTVAYVYDGLNRVVRRDGTVHDYSGLLSQPTSNGFTTITRHADGSVISIANGASSRWNAATDRHNDLTVTFGVGGNRVDSVAYDPFGDIVERQGTTQLMVGFQSHYTDPTTGLVDMGARWYQPWTATFMSRDTVHGMLETPVTLNRYTYGQNNPLNYWDPDGHFATRMIAGGGTNISRTAKPYTPSSSNYSPKQQVVKRTVQTGVPNTSSIWDAFARLSKPAMTTVERAAVNTTTAAKVNADRHREFRKSQYGAVIDAGIEDPAVAAAIAVQVVDDYFVTFDVAKTREPADANGDISPNDYKRVADPANGYPPELQWAAQQIIDQDLTGIHHTKKSMWEKYGGAALDIALVAVSFVPVVGDAMDIVGCLTGDALSCAAAIPGVGMVANAAKAVDKVNDTRKAVNATRAADDAITATRRTTNTAPRTAPDMPHGGNGVVLRDGAGATPAEIAASRGGPTAGDRWIDR